MGASLWHCNRSVATGHFRGQSQQGDGYFQRHSQQAHGRIPVALQQDRCNRAFLRAVTAGPRAHPSAVLQQGHGHYLRKGHERFPMMLRVSTGHELEAQELLQCASMLHGLLQQGLL
mmetsp:Transcript_5514/g.14881  ORF Transcript_5514/g.14881 Transcript_5514/m.14881 type:complete len:117 (+) Transcript_5514:1811-2161(+)